MTTVTRRTPFSCVNLTLRNLDKTIGARNSVGLRMTARSEKGVNDGLTYCATPVPTDTATHEIARVENGEDSQNCLKDLETMGIAPSNTIPTGPKYSTQAT